MEKNNVAAKKTVRAKKLYGITKVNYLGNSFTWMIGLMFSSPKKNVATVFDFKRELFAPIHMWFVSYPLDVFWLNENFKVVDVKFGVKPWASYVAPRGKSWFMVEVVARVENKKIKVGDVLVLPKSI